MSEQTTLATRTSTFRWLFESNATLGTTLTERGYTTTRPASVANESAVIGAPRNHLRISPVSSSNSIAITVRVIGWTKSEVNAVGGATQWCPRTLFVGTFTPHSVKGTLSNGNADLYPMISCSAVMGSANASIVDGTGYKCPGDVMIDCRGSELVEVGIVSASGTPTANVGIDTL